jgi:hypothetical protein
VDTSAREPFGEPSQQLATLAAQIASHKIVELNLFQIRMQEILSRLPFLVLAYYRRSVTRGCGDLLGQLQPPQPELHEAVLRLRKMRSPPHSPAAPTMNITMKFSMIHASFR